jgi:hypothetical protein
MPLCFPGKRKSSWDHFFIRPLTRPHSTRFNNKTAIRYSIDISIPLTKWFYFELVFLPVSCNSITVRVSVNQTNIHDLILPFEFNRNEKLICTVGEHFMPTDYSLSAFVIRASDDSGMISGQAEIKNDSVILKCSSSSDLFVAYLVGSSPMRSPTFASVLTQLCSVDILLPMFAQLDFPIQENAPSVSPATLVAVLSSFLLFNASAQQRFADGCGFLIIRHLLTSSDPRHLSEEVFNEFCTIFQKSSSSDLRYQVFSDILLNFELWSRADRFTLVKIAHHWSHDLYTSFVPISFEICGFRSLLFALIDFFPCSDTSPRISEVRACVFRMAHTVAISDIFQQIDFTVLLGLCLQLQSTDEVTDLIGFVKSLITLPVQLLVSDRTICGYLLELYDLPKSPNLDLVFLILDFFIALHDLQVPLPVGLEGHLLVVAHPELLPICFYIVYSNDSRELEDALMVKLEMHTIRTPSLMWAMMCFARKRPEFARFIANYLLACGVPALTLFASIDSIALRDIFHPSFGVAGQWSDQSGIDLYFLPRKGLLSPAFPAKCCRTRSRPDSLIGDPTVPSDLCYEFFLSLLSPTREALQRAICSVPRGFCSIQNGSRVCLGRGPIFTSVRSKRRSLCARRMRTASTRPRSNGATAGTTCRSPAPRGNALSRRERSLAGSAIRHSPAAASLRG